MPCTSNIALRGLENSHHVINELVCLTFPLSFHTHTEREQSVEQEADELTLECANKQRHYDDESYGSSGQQTPLQDGAGQAEGRLRF